jgi:hypothetical protein
MTDGPTPDRPNGQSASSYRAKLGYRHKATELSELSVCTTWAIRGKDLFLLNVLRKRLGYPTLQRVVRDQQSLSNANVVQLVVDRLVAQIDRARARREELEGGIVPLQCCRPAAWRGSDWEQTKVPLTRL